MNAGPIHVRAPGNVVLVGFGSIGQGTLPVLLRHIEVDPSAVTIITADDRGRDEAQSYGVRFIREPLTRADFRRVLSPWLQPASFLVNLSIDVSSLDLIKLCRERGALYLDTCIEPWAGGYVDAGKTPAARSNYALREAARSLRLHDTNGTTALIAHGANPGLVSLLVKQALLDLQRDLSGAETVPESRSAWSALAMKLGVKTIHIAERDTQFSSVPKQVGEFVNTWSCDAFVSEASQPAELGWGTHEHHLPPDAAFHESGCGASIYLRRPGASVRVRSWTPLEGPYHGFLITHNESISIADYLTVYEGRRLRYRPTCHYAYHPCDSAVLSLHELVGKDLRMQSRQRVLRDDIVDGVDELGVLLAGHARNAYWFGSQLSIHDARRLAPYNNATSLQVCASVVAGMVWAIEHPRAGVVESDEIDLARTLDVMRPYLGDLVGVYTDWTPLAHRTSLFPQDVDVMDPWQFKNVRVA